MTSPPPSDDVIEIVDPPPAEGEDRAGDFIPEGAGWFVLRVLVFTSLILLLWWPISRPYYDLVRWLAQLVDGSDLFAQSTANLGEQGLLNGIIPFAGLLLATGRIGWRQKFLWLVVGSALLVAYHSLSLLAWFSPLLLRPGAVHNRGAELLMGPGRIAAPLVLWLLAVKTSSVDGASIRKFLKPAGLTLLALIVLWSVVLRPSQAGRMENVGRLLHKNGSEDKALEAYAEAARLDPSRVGPLSYLAPRLHSAGRYKEAAEAALAWAEADPDDATPLRLAAESWQAAGNLEQARAAATRVVEIDSDDAEAYLTLANIVESWPDGERYAAGFDRTEAAVLYHAFIELRPQDSRGWLGLGVVLEHGPSGRYTQGCKREEARRAFHRALELDPQSTSAAMALALSLEYNEQGARYGPGAPLAEALEAYTQTVELAPSDLAVRRGRSAVAYRLARYDLATEDLRRILEIEPNNAMALEWLPIAEIMLTTAESRKD